ncbi:MAG: aminotransferase class I/II-fold pyridoxal phosphate-dependent enzyme [Ruminococcaceae bacterium]|nr:aminotransferase class I/II-fold pyridoxal phosphate-dependent enzyme [Oscillospiraceae bacterium]
MYKQLKSLGESDLIRFCMPGHKGKNTGSIFDSVNKYDFTEIEPTDNLFAPEGIIKLSEEKAAELFKSKISAYSACGATPLVKASLYLACKNKNVLAMRGSHMSFFDGAALCRCKVEYLYPELNGGVSMPPTPYEIEKKLEKKKFEALFITSPNYYGVTADIEGIAKACKKYGVILIVDNSHGAHLRFIDGGKNHPLALGADLVIDSVHKTLPVLTGGAILHSNADFTRAQIKRAISLFASTSPSYLVLNSIDCALEMCRQNENLFDLAAKRVADFKIRLKNEGFFILESEPMRITLKLCQNQLDAREINRQLLERYNIACEMADRDNLVLIMSPFDSDEDLEKLFNALCQLKKEKIGKPKPLLRQIPCAQALMEPYQTLFAQTRETELKEAEGKICASHINICPPCIPIVAAGELITKEIIDFITENTDITTISIIEENCDNETYNGNS